MKQQRVSERLSVRLRAYSFDAKKYRSLSERFFFEDMLVYSLIVGAILGADLAHNFLFYLGVHVVSRPYHLGAGQIGLSVVFLMLMLRRKAQFDSAQKESNEYGLPED